MAKTAFVITSTFRTSTLALAFWNGCGGVEAARCSNDRWKGSGKLCPRLGLRTSFIVGFPGETEEDFQELLRFVESARFDNVGVFVYSDEEGTAAFDLDRKVTREVANRRRDKLMTQQAELSRDALRRFIGRRVSVLLDGLSSESDLLLEGRMETQAPEIDGKVLINDVAEEEPENGEFYLTEITESLEYDLIGRIVEKSGTDAQFVPDP